MEPDCRMPSFPARWRRLCQRQRGTNARGFRGVGRLAGLGYAQELIFRSRTAADATVAELTWDCRRLKSALRESDGDIQSLIRSVATLRKKPTGDYPDRFFEVELRGVVRLRSDKLMSPAAVDEYLGQVAPVPFAPEFRFAAEIRDALAPVVALGELEIHIEGTNGRSSGRTVTFSRRPATLQFDSIDFPSAKSQQSTANLQRLSGFFTMTTRRAAECCWREGLEAPLWKCSDW